MGFVIVFWAFQFLKFTRNLRDNIMIRIKRILMRISVFKLVQKYFGYLFETLKPLIAIFMLTINSVWFFTE